MKSASWFSVVVLLVICLFAFPSSAATIAHWNLADAGASDGAYLPGNGSRADLDGDGGMDTDDFRTGSVDLSGNGNHLTAWSSSWMRWTADSYKGDFGMQAANGYPASGTDSTYNPDIQDAGYSGINAETITPAQWTVECVFKATADTNRTMVGRDGYGVRTSDAKTAPLYLAERSNQSINCEFVDVTGNYYNAISANGTLVAGKWYRVAAVSDGTTLTLYLNDLAAGTGDQVVATADLSASADSSLAQGYGTWSVSRGMWDNAHTDRFMGVIDEVAISNTALAPAQFVTRDSVTLTESDGTTLLYAGDTNFTDTYDVVLLQQPTDDVLITATPPAGLTVGNGDGQSKILTFTDLNWDQPQTVTVQIAEAAAPLTSPENIHHTVQSNDSYYNNVGVRDVQVYILDDACGIWGYSQADYNLDCTVNLEDFATFGSLWLETDVPLEIPDVAIDWLASTLTYDADLYSRSIQESSQPFFVNTAAVVNTIDEKIYGHFLEHIYHSANGGLWGEMVWNRSFELGGSGGGVWSIEGDELVQSGSSTDVHLEFGDPAWTDYELTLQARKDGGSEGFLIVFRAPDSDNFYWLNLGGWGNTQHAIEKEVNGGRSNLVTAAGSITTGQWYDIRVRCEGNHIQVWLDEASNPDPLFDITDASFLTGNVGVGTWSTQARFRNIEVTELSPPHTILFSGLPTLAGNPFGAASWTTFGTGVALMSTDALNDDTSVQITGDGSATGLRQDNFKFTEQPYTGSLWMKGTLPAGLSVALMDGETVLGQTTLSAPTASWVEYAFSITPNAATENGSLRITLLGAGTVIIDQVSMMAQDALDTGGYRPDLLEAVDGLRPPIIRWPGGCFASLYLWKDGIGPQHTRRQYPAYMWDDQDTNSYGTDEFLQMCEQIGAEPLICINTGVLNSACGAPAQWKLSPDTQENYIQDALDWMEYCNGSTSTTWGAVRAANGHPEPYNVTFWEIDNETWAAGSAAYIAKVQAFVPALQAKAAELGVPIKISAVGSGGYDQNWNHSIIDACATLIDYISVHYYEGPDGFKSGPAAYENYIINLGNYIAGSANPDMKIYNSEWNAQSTDWRTGLFAGGILNVYERQGAVFEIGGPALFLRHTSASGWDNAFINFDHTGWFAAPNYVVMKLWHDHYAPNRVETTGTDTDLNVVSTLSDDASTLYIQIVNPDAADKSVAFEIDSSFVPETAYMHFVDTDGDLYARNTLAAPDAVHVEAKVIGLDNQTLRFMMPAYSAGVVTVKTTQPHTTKYLYSSFRDNGQDGLHLAYSDDGLTFTALKGDASFLAPAIGSNLMRDPSICQGPDGMFHLVWTTGWNDDGIGIAHSADLINWSAQTYLPSNLPGVDNCWAPEIFYDDATGKYLIFWSSTLIGSGIDGHRIYFIATEDFVTYTDAALFYDPGWTCIDGFIVKDGDRYAMVLKDERNPGKNIRITFSDAAAGPYNVPPSASITPGGLWVEGPSMVKIGQEWMLYYDAYTSGYMGGQSSPDLATWTDRRNDISFPAGTRHGTVFKVTEDILNVLKAL